MRDSARGRERKRDSKRERQRDSKGPKDSEGARVTNTVRARHN